MDGGLTMFRSPQLLVPLIAMVSMSGRPEDVQGPLTPEEVVASRHTWRPQPFSGEVVVKLRVRVVAASGPGSAFLYADAELPERVDFAVELSRAARAAFERVGGADLSEHFAGKEVEVRGRVKVTTIWCFPCRDLYSVRVEGPDQLRVAEAVEAPTGK
jgi:hypothetical protein